MKNTSLKSRDNQDGGKKKSMSQQVIMTLCSIALLTALQIVLARYLSIQLWNLKIGFSFVPVIIAARLFGIPGAMAVYGIGDVIGSILFPSGPFFPGFTLTALIVGLIFGIFLHKKITFPRALISVILTQTLCSFLLNSFWISYTSGAPYTALLATRWPQSLGLGVAMFIFIMFILERICRPVEKILKR